MEVELVNYFITGNIALTKVDKDYPENKLTGAVFRVYSDTNGDGKLDKKEELLGEMGEVEKGVYQMDSLRYGKYARWERCDVLGELKPEKMPAWAKEAIVKIKAQEKIKKPKSREER